MSTTEEELVQQTTLGSWWSTGVRQNAAVSAETSAKHPVVGGARSQSRFSGRSAKPIYASVPLSGAPVTSSAYAPGTRPSGHKSWRLPTRGRTCDGSQPPADAAPASGWIWNIDAWRWESKGNSHAAGGKAEHGGGKAEHAVAARRWGDGRDGLAPALRQSAAAAAEIDSSSGTPRKRIRVEGVRSGGGGEGGFSCVGGMARQKEVLMRQVVLPLRHHALCKHLGVRAGRGLLLHGPPGSGKTHLVRALAAEAGVHLEAVNGADCVGGGRAEARLRRAFAAAANAAPCILFLDEIDALVPSRGAAGTSDGEHQAGALALALLDGLRSSGAAVAVVAASNRSGAVDPALRRPGRLDAELALGAPAAVEREEVLRCAAGAMPLADDVDLADVAQRLRGCMAADIAGAAAEAALHCAADAVNAAAAAGRLHEAGSPEFLAGVRVARRHFEAAVKGAAPSVLRDITAEAVGGLEVTWEAVGGLEEVKAELREMVEWPLRHGDVMARFGLPAAGGALLYGPPGCGKTLLARAVASCCGANFVSVRGPELLQKWLGESERAVRGVFEAARTAAPCVIFFDEIDAVATRRGRSGAAAGGAPAGGGAAAARVLNQLLCELDGVAGRSGVFVLAATNRPAALDPALLRPGRLDRAIKVPLPDAAARLAILEFSLRRCPRAGDVDLGAVAAEAEGMSGADVAEVARRAGTAAVREVIAAERSGGGGDCDGGVRQRHLDDAVGGMRRSVSAAEAARHDATEEALLEGSLPAEEVAAAGGQRQRMQMVARAVQAACGARVAAMQARIAALEAALRAAGVAPPEPAWR